jgi:Protein of unknown function (DUF3634)
MGDDSLWLFLMRAAVGVVVIYVTIRFLLVRRAEFTIRFSQGQAEFKGSFPIAQRAALADLLRDLNLAGRVKIMGARQGARLRVWFGGPLTEGQKQRIRNFLLTRQ